MRLQQLFFIAGLVLTLLGLTIGKHQQSQYQVVLFEKKTETAWLCDPEGHLYANSFSLQLEQIRVERYPTGARKQIHAHVICRHGESAERCHLSVNHPARYHQYLLYLQEYWPSTGGQPAGIRVLLVEQRGVLPVYIGLCLLFITSILSIVQHCTTQCKTSRKRQIVLPILLLVIVTVLIIACNPMMRSFSVPPILRSIWFIPHVIAFILSYALLLLSFVKSWHALRKPAARMVALSQLEVGTAFCTIGIGLGMVWAQRAWGGFWSWDPKETTALIVWTLSVISIAVLRKHQGKQAQQWQAGLTTLITLALLICWFGVALFKMGGLHNY